MKQSKLKIVINCFLSCLVGSLLLAIGQINHWRKIEMLLCISLFFLTLGSYLFLTFCSTKKNKEEKSSTYFLYINIVSSFILLKDVLFRNVPFNTMSLITNKSTSISNYFVYYSHFLILFYSCLLLLFVLEFSDKRKGRGKRKKVVS